MEELKKYIRSIPDFPKPGINFYDITTLLENFVRGRQPQKIVGVESRGFVFGAALADRLQLPFIVARKPGKLPYRTVSEEYALEYGTDTLEMHVDAVSKGDRVVVVDDLIATGGSLLAACKLVERLGGEVVGISTVIGLTFLPFESKLSDYEVQYLISYDSE